ncbi:hypothetical protein BH24PSE2_BH24PSE2_19410 [soil metagenome]
MHRLISFLTATAAVLAISVSAALAQEDADAVAAPSLLFDADVPLRLTIRGPLSRITRDRSAEPTYRPATLLVTGETEIGHELDVAIRPRGRSRRDRKACTFPPLRLNFRTKELDGTVLDGQDKLKLVTHCKDRSRRHEQFVLQEYLLYKSFNALTEDSFRVRLVDVEYIDTDGKRKPVRAPGFLIEHKSELASRRGLEVADVKRIKLAELDPAATALLGVFQYLIGNTDWEPLAGPAGDDCCHNVVPFLAADGSYIPVPYDLDSTGVVDPPYAAPHESLKIKSVRTRLYRGYCLPDSYLDAALERVKSRKDAIYAAFRAQPGLEKKTIERSLDYFDGFYEVLDDSRNLDREIRQACRG